MSDNQIHHREFDKAGNELRPGDFIVYGHSVGRSAALRFGRVVSVNEKKARWDGYVGTTLTVWGVDDDTSSTRRRSAAKRSF